MIDVGKMFYDGMSDLHRALEICREEPAPADTPRQPREPLARDSGARAA